MVHARARLPLIILTLALGALALTNARPATAFAYVVNSTVFSPSTEHCSAADGPCSLWNAIDSANINPGDDTIVFDQSVFTPGTTIVIVSPLPYIDASEGLTIDGGANTPEIKGLSNYSIGFGLVFVTDNDHLTARNIVVRNIKTDNFSVDGVQVCPQPDTNTGTCKGDVDGVTMDNVVSFNNGNDGVNILGSNISNVELDNVHSDFNGVDGAHLAAKYTVANVSMTGGGTDGNVGSGVKITTQSGLESNVTITGIDESNDRGSGVTLLGGGLQSTIADSTIENNTIRETPIGVDVTAEEGVVTGVVIQGNTVRNTTGDGISFGDVFSHGGGGNIVRGNTVIVATHDGIHILGPNTVTISRNSTFLNGGLGINLESAQGGSGVNINDPGDGDSGANTFLNYPVISSIDAQAVQGTACAGCLVELFRSDNDSSGYGEGQTFLRDGVGTPSGQFGISVCGLALQAGDVITSTATDANGNTSEFSANFPASAASNDCPTPTPTSSPVLTATPNTTPTHSPTASPTHSPSPTPTLAPGQHRQGDLDCDGDIDAFDALIAVEAGVGISRPAGDACPGIGTGSPKFGDVDCSVAVDAQDAVSILAYKAGVHRMPQHEPCTNVGDVLPA